MQLFVFHLKGRPRRKHCSGNAFQCDVTSHQLPNPSFKALARHNADLQTKAAQDFLNAQFTSISRPRSCLRATNTKSMGSQEVRALSIAVPAAVVCRERRCSEFSPTREIAFESSDTKTAAPAESLI